MSAISAYRRCPKSFDLGYERLLQPRKTNEAVEDGRSFHYHMEMAAKGKFVNDASPMGDVAARYLKHKPLPHEILSAEEPMYTDVFGDGLVFLRTTFDLVYGDGNSIIGRDYKTFGMAPSMELDLDFQGRVYCAALQRSSDPDEDIRFEYECVRREIFHKTKGNPDPLKPWSVEESYMTFPLAPTQREMDQTWLELQETIYDINRKRDRALLQPATWTRTDLKGNVNSCKGCFFSELCKTEYLHGELTESIIDMLADRREPETLPTQPATI